MSERAPVTETMKASQARAEWSQLLNGVFRKRMRVLVEKSGIPVAAVVSAEDLERLVKLDAERQSDWETVEAIRARNADHDPEDAEREIAAEIAAMRAERRARPARRDTP